MLVRGWRDIWVCWKVYEGWREGEVKDKMLSLKIFKVLFIMTLCIKA